MSELTPADRVVALLEWGDVAEADADIADAGDDDLAWQPALWRAMRALMDGRFQTCERLAATAADRAVRAGEPRAEVLAALLQVALRREQERRAEAESLLRSLLESYPSAPTGAHALLALLIGEMGRDGLARQELARLLPRDPVPITRLAPLYLLAELAAAVQAPEPDMGVLYGRLLPHARDFAVEEGGAVFYGSASLALGLLAQARGRADEAVRHFHDALDAHRAAGAPLLLAHTQRRLAALLRARADAGDWERAVALLSSAVGIYRQLGVDGLAAESQAVLARAEDGLAEHDRTVPAGTQFRRQGDVWMVGPEHDTVRLRDARGLQDIARLLAAPRTPIHVADLIGGAGPRVEAPPYRPWSTGVVQPWLVDGPVLDAETRREYEDRLTDLAGELVEAGRGGDAVRAALARAERDLLSAALGESDLGDPVDRARRTVGTRIRISLDRIERAQPSVGRHLRTAIRTGTFCSYEPDHPVRWAL